MCSHLITTSHQLRRAGLGDNLTTFDIGMKTDGVLVGWGRMFPRADPLVAVVLRRVWHRIR